MDTAPLTRPGTSRILALIRLPQVLPVLGFLAAILVGSLLLSLPFAHRSGAVGYLDALFTSASAVCVTGLVTVNTATDYSIAGQVIIIVLIQLGGLGVMTYAALALTLLRRRMSLRASAALQESLFQNDSARDFKRRVKQIVIATLSIEALGALVLFFALLPTERGSSAAWQAVFHSISAFCNAGFSIFPGGLVDVRSNHLFVAVISLLIIFGGLGFVVLTELWTEVKRWLKRHPLQSPRRFSLHTSLVLRTSLALIVAGAAAMLLLGMTPSETSWGQRVSGALFQSISARTCGFNTVDITTLPLASLLALALLMFVGGSPASCAGGLKTTSLAVLAARLRSYLTGREDARLLGHSLSRDLVRSAEMLFALALLWNLLGFLVLAHTEAARVEVGLQNLVFEQISAFGTVGLSTAATTAGLTTAGKIWIIATMYVGRLGPLTLAGFAVYRRVAKVGLPEGRVIVG